MTLDQAAVLAILAGVLALFVFSPLRHDVVAFIAGGGGAGGRAPGGSRVRGLRLPATVVAVAGVGFIALAGWRTATAIEYDLCLVTRNVKDMRHTGAVLFDPWRGDPGAAVLR